MSTEPIDCAKKNFESKLDGFKKLAEQDLSETDTRCKIVDSILKDILLWPETAIKREPHVLESNGYVDYLLSTTHPYYVIEAKKQRIDLGLPTSGNSRCYVIGGVLSENKPLLKAMAQARDYAVSKGVSFCCVTNGRQFVFFRSQNSEGLDWVRHKAWVFKDLDDIFSSFSSFYELLSYETVCRGLLPSNMPVADSAASPLRHFSRLETRPNIITRTRERNLLYPYLRQVVKLVFEEIKTEEPDSEILRNCYVETPRSSSYERGLGVLLRDQDSALKTRTEKVNIDKKCADNFQNVIESSIKTNNQIPEVLLLLGGVGAGKTTFIHRFRKVLAKDGIDTGCLWAYVNFNLLSGSGEQLLPWVAQKISESLEREHPDLEFDSWDMLKQVYHKEYEKLRKGVLAPLWKSDRSKFDEKFSDHIMVLFEDVPNHVLRTLSAASKYYNRRVFLVFDNADQHDASVQNQVFLIAQKMAQELKCSCLISLREESYWRNRDFGALSAFHSVSYYVQAPRLRQVLAKRFTYASKLISQKRLISVGTLAPCPTPEELDGVVHSLANTILGEDHRFIDFAEYLCPGEIRRPLDFIARFMYSGHTNINSLLQAVRNKQELKIGFHEYLTAIMLCDREYYSEQASDVLNIFAVDGNADASHFNRIVVLGRILRDRGISSELGHGFISIRTVIDDCETLGIFPETTASIISLLMRGKLLQTETQIREELTSSEYIRATSAALYYLEHLVFEFAYLENILFDTPIANKQSHDNLTKLTKMVEEKEAEGERLNRLKVRLERTAVFIDYLVAEYDNSSVGKSDQTFLDPLARQLPHQLKNRFETERTTIFRDAKRVLS